MPTYTRNLTVPVSGMFEIPVSIGGQTGRDLWVEPIVADWGYAELVDNPEHAAALESANPQALAIFEREYARCAEEEGG